MNADIILSLSNYVSREILKQPERRIEPQQALISSGLIDSFSLVDLALFIEDHFSVHLDDTELNASTFDTLEQLAQIIHSRRPL